MASGFRIALFIGIGAYFGIAGTASAEPHWTDYARRFTGENIQVREQAIQALRRDPNLNTELKKSLGTTNHFLALDVISVLGIRKLMPDLITFAARDRTGYSYHVISSLITPKEHDRIGQIYLDRLDDPKTSPASKMAMLDAAARMEVTLGPDRAARLLKDESPEVRSSTLSLFRTELLRRNYQRGLGALETTIRDPAFQIRIQTLYLISELPGTIRRANLSLIGGVLEHCRKDPVGQVQALCKTVGEEAVK